MIACLVMHTCQITKNASCVILVTYSSVTHVCPSCMTQLHVTYSATFNIVWSCYDSPTRHPVGIPVMVCQPRNLSGLI